MTVHRRESTGQTDSANTGQISGIRENIREIHLQRIGGALSEFERCHRRSRRNERIDLFKRLGEILANQLAHFLRAQIISVVITRTQNVGSENDPAFDLLTKTFPACPSVMIAQL